ncbi:MAG: bifunctional hydroxymethylpyrimidine kinase/phosphomethylpyrimidine kinase [Burkholderiales bacterium]|nr:bifunctional hydroxymethylpyrimidine kinase/phosphomethylpyrimidine kinase [Burkholderiales bacterium]
MPRPVVLTIGVAETSSAFGVQADLSTLATLHCYGTSVISGLIVGDSASLQDCIALDAEIVSDSTRLLLEDLPVAAIKIGLPASLDTLCDLAEIVSDYSDLPLVLDPFCSILPESGSASDDIIIGLRDLLIPQASLLMLSLPQLNQLALTWRDEHAPHTLESDVQWLIEHGCAHVLVSGTLDNQTPAGSVGNTLFGAQGMLRHDSWPRLPGQFLGAGACLSAAITALLAHGVELPNAVLQAQLYCAHALSHATRLGMGKLIPARHLLPSSLFEPALEVIQDDAAVAHPAERTSSALDFAQ